MKRLCLCRYRKVLCLLSYQFELVLLINLVINEKKKKLLDIGGECTILIGRKLRRYIKLFNL